MINRCMCNDPWFRPCQMTAWEHVKLWFWVRGWL